MRSTSLRFSSTSRFLLQRQWLGGVKAAVQLGNVVYNNMNSQSVQLSNFRSDLGDWDTYRSILRIMFISP